MIKRLKKEKGFTLIEAIIALGLLGIIGIAFMGALATSSTATILYDEWATSESLARSEMEYVKSQDYSSAEWSYELPSGISPTGQFPEWWDGDHTLPADYGNYVVTVVAEWCDPRDDGDDNDDGLQRITVTVTPPQDPETGKPEPIALEGYKAS